MIIFSYKFHEKKSDIHEKSAIHLEGLLSMQSLIRYPISKICGLIVSICLQNLVTIHEKLQPTGKIQNFALKKSHTASMSSIVLIFKLNQ